MATSKCESETVAKRRRPSRAVELLIDCMGKNRDSQSTYTILHLFVIEYGNEYYISRY